LMNCSVCRNHNTVLSSLMTYHRVCNKINAMGAYSVTGWLLTIPRAYFRYDWAYLVKT
jgi:hypothetical protein